MENSLLAVDIRENGTLRVIDKTTGRIFDRLHYFEDCSDKGGPLKFDPAYESGLTTTLNQRPSVSLVANGELLATYRIEYRWELPEAVCADLRIHVPHGSEWVDEGMLRRGEARRTVTIITDVTLKKDSRMLEFRTVVDNTVRDHRLRVAFPSGMAGTDTCLADAPFDVVERPIPVPDSTGWYEEAARTWPTHSLVSLADDSLRFSLFHSGLAEYEVTDDRERAVALTLLRCFSTAGNPTETYRYQELAQCQGIHRFQYALEIAGVEEEAASVLQRSLNFNIPLHIVQATPHTGTAPREDSFLSVSDEGFVVTCLKKAEEEEAILLRGTNQTERPMELSLRLGFSVARAAKVPLEERGGEPLTVNGRTVTLRVGPKEIASVLLFPAAGDREDTV